MTHETLIYTNERGESIEFSPRSIYHVNDITGLADVSNTLYSSSGINQDGETFVGTRLEARNIGISGSIAIRDKTDMRQARQWLAHVLNPHLSGTLIYRYGGFERIIDCNVDSSPTVTRGSVLFKFAVSFKCLNPYWREADSATHTLAIWTSAFEFPIELPEADEWEIGYKLAAMIVNVENTGDVDIGVTLTFTAVSALTNPYVVNVATQEQLAFALAMGAGDVLVICTSYGRKSAKLQHDGAITDAFGYMVDGSVLLQLRCGDNLLRCGAETGADGLEVIVRYDNLYLGV